MLDLNDLRLFVGIADQQGIVKAGRLFNLPKSTMSRRLSALEDQVKGQLVIRNSEEFRLTELGKELYDIGKSMLEITQLAENVVDDKKAQIAGKVSLSVSPLIGELIFRSWSHIEDPFQTLSLTIDISDRSLEGSSSFSDLHIVAHSWQLRDNAFVQRRICRNPLLIVGAPDLDIAPLQTEGGILKLPHRLFSYGRDSEETTFIFKNAYEKSVVLSQKPSLVTTDATCLTQLAIAGHGVAILPEFAVRESVRSGLLISVLPGWIGPDVTFSLLTPSRRLMSKTLRYVADTVGELIRDSVIRDKPLYSVVPNWEPAVPANIRRIVTGLSYASSSKTLSEPESPASTRPEIEQAESDLTMLPSLKALGIAAMATAGIPLVAVADDAQGPLVLYTNDFEGVITDRFEADSGRQIDVVQMSGGEILARIAAEANNPQWDVLIYNGSYSFHSLDQQGLLKRDVSPSNINNLNEIGVKHMPENRSWFPIGMAASCVIVYRPDLVKQPPVNYADLADPRFKGMFGMADPAVAAPAYPCVAEFFNSMGKEKAEGLFTSFFDNGMRVFRTNGPVGRALTAGEISVAMITSQVAYTLKASSEAPIEIVWPQEGAPGVIRGVGIQAKTQRPEAAQDFVEWLLKPETQGYLQEAADSDGLFEPTVKNAPRRADGPAEGLVYRVAPDDYAVEHEAEIKTWFADRAVN
jgi:ABC-type Fe3+ transport system substrate-binding protein/DNA-binding transcriptional LysR family regulator